MFKPKFTIFCGHSQVGVMLCYHRVISLESITFFSLSITMLQFWLWNILRMYGKISGMVHKTDVKACEEKTLRLPLKMLWTNMKSIYMYKPVKHKTLICCWMWDNNHTVSFVAFQTNKFQSLRLSKPKLFFFQVTYFRPFQLALKYHTRLIKLKSMC